MKIVYDAIIREALHLIGTLLDAKTPDE